LLHPALRLTRLHRLAGGISLGDAAFRAAAFSFAFAVLALMGLMAYELVTGSRLSLERFGWRFLIDTVWDPVALRFGALPFIYGTIVTSFLALLLAVPVGLGAAIFLAELAPGVVRTALSFLAELLAAIPSVVYGLWGMFLMVPWLQTRVQPLLGETLGFIPLFAGPAYGVGLLAGGLILAIMILPTIIAVSRDVLLAVPQEQREAMLALGATRWEAIWMAVLPYARSGIIGAIILALARAIGETMAVTMVIGNRPEITLSLFAPASTMASVLANEFTEAAADLHLHALIEIALILFGLSFLLNALARLLVWRVTVPLGGAR